MLLLLLRRPTRMLLLLLPRPTAAAHANSAAAHASSAAAHASAAPAHASSAAAMMIATMCHLRIALAMLARQEATELFQASAEAEEVLAA